MDEKELKAMREKSQAVTNILDKEFYFKWDGMEHSIKKGETKHFPYYLAEHCAIHMARKWFTIKNKADKFHLDGGRKIDEIMGKTFVDYDKLTLDQATNLSKERKIDLQIEGKDKNRATLIQDLKNTH